MKNLGLFCAMKNEGPFVLEFVAHHKALGIEKIHLVTNPSNDGTNEIAQMLADFGFVKHICVQTPPNFPPQQHAYRVARQAFGLDDLEWLIIIDADELLNVHIGDRGINDLLLKFDPTIDIISINMACFGNFPHSNWSPEASSSRFLYRIKSAAGSNSPSKSIIRNPGNFAELWPHGPKGFKLDRLVNIAFHGGLEMASVDPRSEDFYKTLRSPGCSSLAHSIAQINHYVIRTFDSFSLRRVRGEGTLVPNRESTRYDEKYFRRFANARFLDDSILLYHGGVKAAFGKMLSIPEIRECQDRIVANYKAVMDAMVEH